MAHRRLIAVSIATACILALAGEASAAGSGRFEFSYGARLTSADGAPLGGAVDLELAFYRTEAGGDALSAPLAFPATVLSTGIFQLAVTLDPTEARAIFPDTEQPVWIEVRDLTHGRTYPRQRFLGAPYALRVPVDGVTLQFDAAGALQVVQAPVFSGALAGDVQGDQAGTVVTRIQGAPVASTPAASGQVLKWNGAVWAPADDAGGATANSNAASLTSGTLDDARLSANVSLLGPTIESSEIAAGTIASVNLADGAVTAAKLADAGCTSGQMLKWSDGGWTCADDVDTNTPTTSASSLTSGTLDDARLSTNISKLGATIEGNEIAAGAVSATHLADGAVTVAKLASAGCSAGQMLKWNGTAWTCASDVDTNTPTTNAADLTTGTLDDARLSASVSKLGATIEGSEITDGTITGDDIASGAVGDDHIAAGIDALKIGDGSVSNVELAYLEGVTSPLQTQLADRVSKAGDELSGLLSVNIAAGAGTQDAFVVKNSQRLRFENDQASPNSISLRAPTGVFTNQTYVLPAAPGTDGQVLQTDASGNLSWSTPGSSLSSLTQLTVSCAAGHVIKSDGGGAWSCQADADSGGAGGSTPSDGSVSTVKLVDGAVTAAKLNSMGCLSGQVMKYNGSTWTCAADDNNNVTSDASLLTSGTLATARLPATVSLLGATIDSGEISDGAVTAAKLAADAVTSAKILDGSIANADISGSAQIATSKLSGAVTAIVGHGLGSLAGLSAVGSAEITNGSIVDADIAGTAAISSTKISFAADSISGDAINGGVISNFQSTGIEDNAASLAMTLDPTGNVGIGTTTPQSALQVGGYLQLDTVSSPPSPTDCDAASEYGRMKVDPTSGTQRLFVCTAIGWSTVALVDASAAGEESYTTAGTYSFVVPSGVTSIAAVAVGGGGGGGGSPGGSGQSSGGGGGGALVWGNGIPVTPGETLTVVVGAGGAGGSSSGVAGGYSEIKRGSTVLMRANGGAAGLRSTASAAGGAANLGGYPYNTGGGSGGAGGPGTSGNGGGGGGGAGGYSGDGGKGGYQATAATAGAGGGGGGGGEAEAASSRPGGGGVGLFGEGTSGAAGAMDGGGVGGSSGQNGSATTAGTYGGGGGGVEDDTVGSGSAGERGAVRIIWGPGRSFPSNAN